MQFHHPAPDLHFIDAEFRADLNTGPAVGYQVVAGKKIRVGGQCRLLFQADGFGRLCRLLSGQTRDLLNADFKCLTNLLQSRETER